MNPSFHLAFPVKDLQSTRDFYDGLLGCKIGRSTETWIDFDFYGHQLSAHVKTRASEGATNDVDGDKVPIPHFGVILSWDQWHELAARLKIADVPFLVKPHIRFQGEVGEQATMFLLDPSGNAIEFKSFQNAEQVFARSS